MLDKETSNAVARVINNTPNYVGFPRDFFVQWGRTGIGFGEVYFYTDDNGNICCENEGMSKDFVKEVLNDLVDQAEFKSVRPE